MKDVVSKEHKKINSCFSMDTSGEQQTCHAQLIMTINNNRLDSQDLTTAPDTSSPFRGLKLMQGIK